MRDADKKGRKLKRATLIAFNTADGFWRVHVDRATLGKVYTVDMNTIRREVFLNQPTGTRFICEVVDAYGDESKTWNHFPTEILEIEK